MFDKGQIVYHPLHGYAKIESVNKGIASVHKWLGAPNCFSDGTVQIPVKQLSTTTPDEPIREGVVSAVAAS